MRKINKIIIHCSSTYPWMDVGVKEIRRWHVQEKNYSDIGYHYVVRRDGSVEIGRDIENRGAHAYGHNFDSVGVCWVGGLQKNTMNPEDNRTVEQINSLQKLLKELKEVFPEAEILGHRDLPDVAKACPCFDAKEEYKEI